MGPCGLLSVVFQVAFEAGEHFVLYVAGADDAEVRYPVLDDGHNFHFVDVFAGEQQAAVVKFADEFLVRQQAAAQEVGRGVRRDADDDFCKLVAVVDAVAVVDFRQQGFVRGEGFGFFVDGADLTEAEGALAAVVRREADEVPDAVFIEQTVGVEAVVFAVFFSGFGVVEFDAAVLFDSLLQAVKVALARFDVFVLEAFDLDAADELFLVKTLVNFREHVLHAGKAREAFDVGLAEMAEFGFVQAVVTGAFFEKFVFKEGKAFGNVTLDGARGDAVGFRQFVDRNAFTCVQPFEDAA